MEPPQLWVFAGPNGAGKSTLVDRFAKDRLAIVNPDDIARRLPPTATGGLDELEAGRRAIAERSRFLAARETFGFETTLSGNTELKLMHAASAAGYKVNLVYVGIPNAEMSALRVSTRVSGGGHNVSRQHTERRYARTMANLPKAMNVADRSFVLDNTTKRLRLIMARENDRARYESVFFPTWAVRAIPAELRRDITSSEPAEGS